MKVSIIVPVHNSGETLDECLNAISRSDYKDYELIIVDDASGDNSIDIARRFPCRIVSLETNKGVAFARNKGASEAKNEILLFIDSDIIIKHDSIDRIIARLSRDNDIAGVSGVYDIHNRRRNFLSQYKHMVACYREKMCEDVNQDSFKTAFFAIKKELFAKIGFDESFKKASIEDIELGRVLIAMGARFILDKSIIVEHVRRFTVKTFIKNQYNRSKDIAKVLNKRETRDFYYSKERKNRYAKQYILRVPVSWLVIIFLSLFLITGDHLFLFCDVLLLLVSIIIEWRFLGFCLKHKGFIFTLQCIIIYFFDGFISGLGVLRSILGNISSGGHK